MLNLANKGIFRNALIASAHLYFSVVQNLSEIMLCANKVFIFSDRKSVADKLIKKYQNSSIEYIQVGKQTDLPLGEKPGFLVTVNSMLPQDMTGTLSLIGAGPWAEIYITWIKQKGGVAVDIGSGFDLLDGQVTRPIHRSMGANVTAKLSL